MTQSGVFVAIAALVVKTTAIVPRVLTYNALPNSAPSGTLPVRLLMPFERTGAESADFSHIALGPTARATRQIVDLLLYQPAGQGQTIATPTGALVDYGDAYEAAVRADRSLGMAQGFCRELRINTGVFEYAGQSYYGVEVLLTVEDYQHG